MRKQEKANLLGELKGSFSDYKGLGTVFYKDLAFFIFIILLFVSYFAVIKASSPPQPFSQATIYEMPLEELNAAGAALQTFYAIFIFSSAALLISLFYGATFAREWVWTGILKQRVDMKKTIKFLGVNLIIYAFLALMLYLAMLLSGTLMWWLSSRQASDFVLEILAILAMIIILPVILQILNFSAYTFVKTRKFLRSIYMPFVSFSKTKSLLLPYLFVVLAIFILGIFSNLLLLVSQNWFFSGISFLLLVIFISWQKIYLAKVYERVYQ